MRYGFEERAAEFLVLHSPLNAKRIAADVEYEVFTVDLSSVFRHFVRPALLIFTTVNRFQESLEKWENSRLPNSELVAIVLHGSTKSEARSLREQLPYPDMLLVQIQEVLQDGNVRETWRRLLLQYGNAEQLSPYRINIAAGGKMFFGRRAELSKLTRSHGCAMIYGPRRIGKTSVALRLSGHMREDKRYRLRLGDFPIYRSSYVDVGKLGEHGSRNIWGEILRAHGLDTGRFQLYARRSRFSRQKEYDGSEANALDGIISAVNGELTIILDEVDGWIRQEAHESWPALDRLRGMTDEGRAKVILVGYEALKRAAQDDRFPFALRGEVIHLGPLTRRDFDDLVTLPMGDLKIELQQREVLLDKIWLRTSGFPHLVQDICGRLVERAIKQRRSEVTAEDLGTVTAESEHFKSFTRGMISGDFPLAEAVCYATIVAHTKDKKSPAPNFQTAVSLNQIIAVLKEFDYSYDSWEMESAMSSLELRWILKPIGNERDRWVWVNEYQYERARKVLFGTGKENLLGDLLEKHKVGLRRRRSWLR
jgi:hypothetical protein